MNPYFLILKSDQNGKQSYVRYQPGSASGNIKNCPVPTWLCSLCVFYIIKPNFPGFNPVIRRIYTVAVHNTEQLSQNTLHLRKKNRTLSIKYYRTKCVLNSTQPYHGTHRDPLYATEEGTGSRKIYCIQILSSEIKKRILYRFKTVC